jgi:hypothetical protein
MIGKNQEFLSDRLTCKKSVKNVLFVSYFLHILDYNDAKLFKNLLIKIFKKGKKVRLELET